MSNNEWLGFKFGPPKIFERLKPPLEKVLSVLETIEKILEALLALIKAFSLDLVNPLRALIALLLAAIRAILNQIRATGFASLLIRPDFRQSDLRGVFNSVSGGYRSFESKVIGKFYDEVDPFRPQYGPGMNAAMFIFYIGAESPGDLMSEIMALLALIKHPIDISLSAPVSLTVSTPSQSGDPASQFWHLFQPSKANKSLVLEWKMPTSASGLSSSTLVGQISSSLLSYASIGQKFLIERTDGDKPNGEYVTAQLDTKTQGKRVENTIRRYNIPSVSTKVFIKEKGGSRYKFFRVRRKADLGISVMGLASGTYRYIDTDLEAGKSYNYRVRGYLGELNDNYVDNNNITVPEDVVRYNLTRHDPVTGLIINYGKNVIMGSPSAIVQANVSAEGASDGIFKLDVDILNAIVASLLLNFELPRPFAGDSSTVIEQKTGWGTLSVLAGPIGWMKHERPDSSDFVKHPFLKPAVRRLVNPAIEKLIKQSQMSKMLSKLWAAGVKETVENIIGYSGFGSKSEDISMNFKWGLIGVMGDMNDSDAVMINEYLALDDPGYELNFEYDGPLPIDGQYGITVQQRSDLADFVRLSLSLNGQSSGYLQWYSVTIGDLFPALSIYLFDFEQWILALLKALNSALQEIADIIETLLQRIRDLQQLLRAILALIDMLSIEISVSALGVKGNNGVEDLIQGLLNSENKPGESPYGLHSGYVFTAGGPGPGFVKALEALKFIVTGGSFKD